MGNILSQTLILRVLWPSHFHLSMSWIPPILFVFNLWVPSLSFIYILNFPHPPNIIPHKKVIHLCLYHDIYSCDFSAPIFSPWIICRFIWVGLKRERIHVAFQLVFGRGQELLCYIVTTQRNELAIFELPSSLSFRPNCKRLDFILKSPWTKKKIPRIEASKQNVIAMWSNY